MLHICLVIVAGDSIVRLDLRELLQALGYQVVGEAGDGPSALTLARELRPDLVLMELRLAGPLDGLAVASALTREQVAPVLLLTACDDSEQVRRAVQAGVAGYRAMPFDEDQLRPAIEMALDRDPESPARAREAGDLRAHPEEPAFLEGGRGLAQNQQPVSEPEASRPMQATSPNACPPMGALAETLLRADHVPP